MLISTVLPLFVTTKFLGSANGQLSLPVAMKR